MRRTVTGTHPRFRNVERGTLGLRVVRWPFTSGRRDRFSTSILAEPHNLITSPLLQPSPSLLSSLTVVITCCFGCPRHLSEFRPSAIIVKITYDRTPTLVETMRKQALQNVIFSHQFSTQQGRRVQLVLYSFSAFICIHDECFIADIDFELFNDF